MLIQRPETFGYLKSKNIYEELLGKHRLKMIRKLFWLIDKFKDKKSGISFIAGNDKDKKDIPPSPPPPPPPPTKSKSGQVKKPDKDKYVDMKS